MSVTNLQVQPVASSVEHKPVCSKEESNDLPQKKKVLSHLLKKITQIITKIRTNPTVPSELEIN